MSDYDRKVAQICRNEGAIFSIQDTHGRHKVVIVQTPNGPRKIFISRSPSDHRAILNFQKNLRRAMSGSR
jgi:hypothetical protein